ncbi:MAG: hypothetical protein QXR60_04680 [Candidatus Nanoarchaeia archaeon]
MMDLKEERRIMHLGRIGKLIILISGLAVIFLYVFNTFWFFPVVMHIPHNKHNELVIFLVFLVGVMGICAYFIGCITGYTHKKKIKKFGDFQNGKE